MAQLTIVRFPHEALTTPAEPVDTFDEALGTFIDDMAETMYAADGVGLAANQVAVLKRVTVIDTAPRDEPAQLVEIINPVIVERSEEPLVWEEGCLSFPELYEKVERAARVKVAFQDRHGAPQEIEAEGLLSVALQHEIDHLDGINFIDRISKLGRVRALRRFDQIMKRRRAEGLEPA